VRRAFDLVRCAAGAFGALLLLSATPQPIRAAPDAAAGEAHAPTAILISARDDVADPDFAGSVVLVMNNLGPAPVGIIVNRPTPVPVSRLFPAIKRLAQLPDKLYFGGPVEFGAVWFLFRAAKPPDPEHTTRAFDDVYLSADRKLLLQLLGREKPMEGLKIFVGHAGWAPGQLQDEIAHGDWALERADPEAIFHPKPENPWPSTQAPKRST